MNLLDIVLLFVCFFYLFAWAKTSAVYQLTQILCAFVAYSLALYVAAYVANNFFSEAASKTIATLVIIVGFLILSGFVAHRIGTRLRYSILGSKRSELDTKFLYPVKVFGILLLFFSVTQTLSYIPLLPLQQQAQGSTISLTADKFMPDTSLRALAATIYPEQFTELTLKYDSEPITTELLEPSEQFGKMAFTKSASVVRVTGSSRAGVLGSYGTGSGFAVGDGLYATAAHVVIGLDAVFLRPVGGGAYPATPLVIDQTRDIAIVKSNYLHLPPLTLRDTRLSGKAPAMVLGFPGGKNLTSAEGLAYEPGEDDPKGRGTSVLDKTNTYTFTGTVIPGNSGSAVFDREGRVIGVAISHDLKRKDNAQPTVLFSGRKGDANLVDSLIVAKALDDAQQAFRSQGTGLGRMFEGY